MGNPFSFGPLALPTAIVTLLPVAALLSLPCRRVGTALMLAGSLCLFIAATPVFASFLLWWVEARLPQHADLATAQAIVVLSGDRRFGNGTGIPDTLGPLSLNRVAYAAAAYGRLHLPVAVSGGRPRPGHVSDGDLMKAALETDFGVPVAWDENRSHTTWENALYSARLLRPAGIKTVVLVTDSWHLPRAIWAFNRVGFTALPWPAPRDAVQRGSIDDFLPAMDGLQRTYWAVHELIGAVYYRLRH